MNRWKIAQLIFIGVLLCSKAWSLDAPIDPHTFSPTEAKDANWLFSGMVSTENGDQYGYFFQLQRHTAQFQSLTAVFDAQNRKILLLDENTLMIPNPNLADWRVGDAFLNFNSITDSWIFGLKNAHKKGFNFKVDMLSHLETASPVKNLRPGLEMIIGQARRLNGHLWLDGVEKEQFVTSKNAWFRQVWISASQAKTQQVNSVFCRFNDGSGFYSVNTHEADAIQGALTGAYDQKGQAIPMTQFIEAKLGKDQQWHIRSHSHKINLVMTDVTKRNHWTAGFVHEKNKIGFCLLSKNMLGTIPVA